jgi:hypothetical protein
MGDNGLRQYSLVRGGHGLARPFAGRQLQSGVRRRDRRWRDRAEHTLKGLDGLAPAGTVKPIQGLSWPPPNINVEPRFG